MRTWGEHYGPGGGGINAARVVQELGGAASAIYLSGGTTGPVLDGLVRSSGIQSLRIAIADHTRISHTVHERSSGLEFRFVPEGPVVEPGEWQACLAALEGVDCDYLLASGSLPRGVPTDFYVQVGKVASRRGAKLVLDTSGEALRAATSHAPCQPARSSTSRTCSSSASVAAPEPAMADAALLADAGLVLEHKAQALAGMCSGNRPQALTEPP